MMIFGPGMPANQVILSIKEPMEFIGYSMAVGDAVSFDLVKASITSERALSHSGCKLMVVSPEFVPVAYSLYAECGSPVRMTSSQARQVVWRPGLYRLTYSGFGFGSAIVEVEQASKDAVEAAKLNCRGGAVSSSSSCQPASLLSVYR